MFVVGSLNGDLLVSVERRPEPGETILGGDAQERPGGKGANQAVAAARLGARVAMLGRVGDDLVGRSLRDGLVAEGVDVTYVTTSAEAPTGRAVITVTPDGENAIIVSPGANARLGAGDVDAARDAIVAARAIVLQLEIPLDAVARAVQTAARAQVAVILNLAPIADVPAAVLAGTDVLVVNEHEASALLGASVEGASAAQRRGPELLGRGPRSAVITLGAAGAVAVGEDGSAEHVPAPRVRAIDTTGAGDAFVGALAAELVAGRRLAEATGFAARAGAAATLAAGAQSALPGREDLEKLFVA